MMAKNKYIPKFKVIMKIRLFCLDKKDEAAPSNPENFRDHIFPYLMDFDPQMPESSDEAKLDINIGSIRIEKLDSKIEVAEDNYYRVDVDINEEGETEIHLENACLLRENLLNSFSENMHFSEVVIVSDELSETIAKKMFPIIQEIESEGRSFLAEFFYVQVGSQWLDDERALTEETKKEIRKRAEDEKKERKTSDPGFFYSNADLMFLDFKHISEIIMTKEGNFSIKDLLNRINSADDLKKLQEDIKTTHDQFFSSYFDSKFKTKWITVSKLRNAVMHLRYLHIKDFRRVEDLKDYFKRQFDEAKKEILNLKPTEEAYSKFEGTKDSKDDIDTETNSGEKQKHELIYDLLNKFNNEERLKNNWSFIGLSQFLNYVEENSDFDRIDAKQAITYLNFSGKIKVYKEPNDKNPDFPTSAIELKNQFNS